MNVVRGGKRGVGGPSAGQQFEQVPETRRLDVVHRVPADMHARDRSPHLGRRDYDLADLRVACPEPDGPQHVAAADGPYLHPLGDISDI